MIDDFRFGRITVIGDLLLDQYISGGVSRISPEAPFPSSCMTVCAVCRAVRRMWRSTPLP